MINRDEYVEKLKQQLDQWNAEVSQWESKAKLAQESMRAEYEKQLAAYRSKRDHALEQLSKVQSATGEAWKEFARAADDAWARMSEAFEKAGSHFKK
jgi:lipid II:glycine glycyltransferase (peptidoglycan interpeptide bridge formation enzyme)